MIDPSANTYEVVVIGGGAAGLSGALMLARSRRSVLVIDSGAPRNAPSHGVHGFLGHDGTPPLELLKRGRDEVRRYGGEVKHGEVTGVASKVDDFTVQLASDESVRARRLLVTTGIVDDLPDVPGLKERWGRDVLHCPYCHGWEVKDKRVGVLARGHHSIHQALMFRQLSEDILFFSHKTQLEDEQARQLVSRGIQIVEGEVSSLEIADDRLTGVRLKSGDLFDRDALVVTPQLVVRAGFLSDLGLKPVDDPSGMGEHLEADSAGKTSVPGVWAAGNLTDPAAQVGAAAAAGAWAGARINAELVDEECRSAAKNFENAQT